MHEPPISVNGDAVFLAARKHVVIGDRTETHTHHLAELFWVEQGEGFHCVNRVDKLLFPGILVMLRPGDKHAFRTTSRNGLTYVSLLFNYAVIESLHDRYFMDLKNFWSGDKSLPTHHCVSLVTIHQLRGAVDALMTGPRNRFFLEHFLMDIIHTLMTAPYGRRDYVEPVPDWLQSACERIKDREQFSKGPRQLVRLACRCSSHVARVARQTLNKTPSEIVNDARLSWAASQLATTKTDIMTIAMDGGFTSLSYFYKVFKLRYNRSPSEFRRQQQCI